MISLLLGVAVAAASDDWYLETPDTADRAAADELLQRAGADGRVVRRFADGLGWRYVVRVEGFGDATSAETAARGLADALDVPISVFHVDGSSATRVEEIAPPDPAPAPIVDLPDARPVLDLAVTALGVDAATYDRARHGPVLVKYVRTLPDGREIHHAWSATGGAERLEITGTGVTPSVTVVNAEGAWLSVDGGPLTPQNAEKTRQLVGSLGPAEVLPLVLALGAAVDSRREFERMVVTGTGAADGVATQVLRFPGDAVGAPLELEVGTANHLPRRIRFEDSAVVYELSSYQKRGGLDLPSTVETLRDGKLADTVEIELLDLDPQLPASGFAGPG